MTAYREVAFLDELMKLAATLDELGAAARRLKPVQSKFDPKAATAVMQPKLTHQVTSHSLREVGSVADEAQRLLTGAQSNSRTFGQAPGWTPILPSEENERARIAEHLRFLSNKDPKSLVTRREALDASNDLLSAQGLPTLPAPKGRRNGIRPRRRGPRETVPILLGDALSPEIRTPFTLHEGFERKFGAKPKKFKNMPFMSHADIGVLLDEVNMIKKLKGEGADEATRSLAWVRKRTGENDLLKGITLQALGPRGAAYAIAHGYTPAMKKAIRRFVASKAGSLEGNQVATSGRTQHFANLMSLAPEDGGFLPGGSTSPTAARLMNQVLGQRLAAASASSARQTQRARELGIRGELWSPETSPSESSTPSKTLSLKERLTDFLDRKKSEGQP